MLLAGGFVAAAGGVGLGDKLAAFFRNSIGDRFGERPLLLVPDALVATNSFSGDGDEPPPVAELRLDVERPTVVSKCRNL